jgi:hypothetical protein
MASRGCNVMVRAQIYVLETRIIVRSLSGGISNKRHHRAVLLAGGQVLHHLRSLKILIRAPHYSLERW